MGICPKCGAQNLPSAISCRLCETPLEAKSQKIDSLSPTIRNLDQSLKEDEMESMQTDGIACPSCGTMNEVGWAFCQHCGSKLPQMAAPLPPKPQSDPLPPAEQPTVVAQQPVRDYNLQPAQPTVAEQPPVKPPQASLATVVDQPPIRPPVEEPDTSSGKQTVVAQPPAEKPNYNLGQVTVPDQQPHFTPPPQMHAPPSHGGTEPVPHPEKPTAGIPCPQCGHINPPGGAFCSACGNSIAVAKTLVMTSRPPEPPPAQGKLHLIMEGGQPGDVYELKDKTIIGRVNGDISFPHDGFMSGKHASIEQRGEKFVLTDEGSRNGTFIRINGEVELKPGDMVLIGKQLFRFEI